MKNIINTVCFYNTMIIVSFLIGYVVRILYVELVSLIGGKNELEV